jgi:hypothetical protein
MTLAAQGPAVRQNSSIVGLLKTAAGTPASRVSVAAAAVTGDRSEFDRTAVVSLVQTDEQGRYLLENIPPGHYYIVAGRLDFPTFYPGGIRSEAATALEISSGVQVLGIDFTVDEDSVRPGTPSTLKVQVLIEGGGPVPDTAARPIIQLTRTGTTKSLEVPAHHGKLYVVRCGRYVPDSTSQSPQQLRLDVNDPEWNRLNENASNYSASPVSRNHSYGTGSVAGSNRPRLSAPGRGETNIVNHAFPP